jgi:CBS domain-containing protein
VNFQLNLNGETVQRAQPSRPLCVDPEVPVGQVLGLMKQHREGSVLICRDGILAGVFTERDALKLMAAGADLDRQIAEVMSSPPETVAAGATVGAAITKMASGGYRSLPVVDGAGRPVAVVKVSHILHYLVEHFPEFVYTLPPKPHHTTQRREGA